MAGSDEGWAHPVVFVVVGVVGSIKKVRDEEKCELGRFFFWRGAGCVGWRLPVQHDAVCLLKICLWSVGATFTA